MLFYVTDNKQRTLVFIRSDRRALKKKLFAHSLF